MKVLTLTIPNTRHFPAAFLLGTIAQSQLNSYQFLACVENWRESWVDVLEWDYIRELIPESKFTGLIVETYRSIHVRTYTGFIREKNYI